MRVTGWLDGYQQRHRWAGFPVAVIYKFVEDQGPYLAALITYYGFLSLFPLLLLLTSVLGFVLQDNPELQQRILDSTLSQFPVIGDELSDPQGLQGSGGAVVVGGLVALYGALGVAQAFQNAMNVAWSVPRNRRPNPIRARLRSLLLIGTAGIAVLATTILSALGGSAADSGADVSGWSAVARDRSPQWSSTQSSSSSPSGSPRPSSSASRDVVARRHRRRRHLAAAPALRRRPTSPTSSRTRAPPTGCSPSCSACWRGSSSPPSASWSSVEINVVRTKRLYPRALLTPFTDNVDLTGADQRAYTDAATAQRHKGFESVDVTFDHDGQEASARKRTANELTTNQHEIVRTDDA